MLISYNNKIGNATNINVNISDEGIMITVIIKTATIATTHKYKSNNSKYFKNQYDNNNLNAILFWKFTIMISHNI